MTNNKQNWFIVFACILAIFILMIAEQIWSLDQKTVFVRVILLITGILLVAVVAFTSYKIERNNKDEVINYFAEKQDKDAAAQAGILRYLKYRLGLVGIVVFACLIVFFPEQPMYDIPRGVISVGFVMLTMYVTAHMATNWFIFRRRWILGSLFDAATDWDVYYAYKHRKSLEMLTALWLPLTCAAMSFAIIIMNYGRAINGEQTNNAYYLIGGITLIMCLVWLIRVGGKHMQTSGELRRNA